MHVIFYTRTPHTYCNMADLLFCNYFIFSLLRLSSYISLLASFNFLFVANMKASHSLYYFLFFFTMLYFSSFIFFFTTFIFFSYTFLFTYLSLPLVALLFQFFSFPFVVIFSFLIDVIFFLSFLSFSCFIVIFFLFIFFFSCYGRLLWILICFSVS